MCSGSASRRVVCISILCSSILSSLVLRSSILSSLVLHSSILSNIVNSSGRSRGSQVSSQQSLKEQDRLMDKVRNFRSRETLPGNSSNNSNISSNNCNILPTRSNSTNTLHAHNNSSTLSTITSRISSKDSRQRQQSHLLSLIHI